MPHLRLEYSANLATRADIAGLCAALHDAMMESGLFELGAVRVRAFAANDYAIADRLPENTFLDMVLRIGAGRSAEDKRRIGEALMAAASTFLASLFETPHFALSLEVVEIDPVLSWKKNAIHPRLRGH